MNRLLAQLRSRSVYLWLATLLSGVLGALLVAVIYLTGFSQLWIAFRPSRGSWTWMTLAGPSSSASQMASALMTARRTRLAAPGVDVRQISSEADLALSYMLG